MTASDRPNVILLVVDALRADEVEGYGAPPGASPTMGQLGRTGAAVSDVRTTASWTLPAHIAMFSGQLARGLGLGQAPDWVPQSAAPIVQGQRPRLLAEVLRSAGYETRGMTGNGWAGTPGGFSTGFDHFTDLRLGRHGKLGGGIAHRLKWIWEGIRATADDGAAHAEATVVRWIGERSEKPFFWFVNLIECHSPYLPPRPYADRSPMTRALAADEAFRYLTFESFLLANLGKRTVPEPAIERMRNLYRAALRYVDDWLARLLDLLDRQRLLEDTLLVVCSDHGENFGVGGLMGHGLSLDDRLLRVPFIVAGPGRAAFEGMRSLVELPSRIGRAVGLQTHPWADGGLPAGLPVAQWDPFDLSEALHETLAREWKLEDEDFARLTSPLTCAVDGHLKLVRGRAREDESLFDLEADPLEVRPLRGEALEERAGAALEVLREAVNHPAVQDAPEHVAPAEPASPDELADIERRMRLMGYM